MSTNVVTFTGEIASAVRAEMGRRKLPLYRLAEPLGLSWPTISNRLNAHTPFTSDEIDAVARFLGMSPYELIVSADPVARTTAQSDEVARITPPHDTWAQPARSKARRRA